ncbi:HNH endonuclease signature motif containing protein [Microbacterium mangrovi]|uniref:HNH endonuclease signature motif containing protein n=1 Tax=Microbacterium mangrovi TaxID=1348253 RepID=UPI0006898698|nr:HNH endonuclease signature motif containing protein [Microbacterium mangrovi]
MDTFEAIVEQNLQVLAAALGAVSVRGAGAVMTTLRDDDVIAVIESTSSAIRELEGLRVLATGIAAQRSTRDAGHGGLAQKRGHRSAVALVQDLTGVSRTQAGKVTQLGRSLLETIESGADAPGPEGGDKVEPRDDVPPGPPPERPWHACLGDAFTSGRVSVDQQAAIRRGLGEPPESGDPAMDADARAAWATAAEQLVDEASRRTVEDLGSAARCIRDQLDPEGARRRFEEQYEARSFRMWRDADGVTCAKIRFEPGGAAWVTSVLDAALRPRRGGPRFVDPDEKAAADALVADPRTNDQLAYDLLIDVLHTGSLADAASVFGARQAGVRVVVTDTSRGRTPGTGHASGTGHDGRRTPGVAVIEDTNTTVPAAFAAQHVCDTGTTAITIDPNGNPLTLGRDTRLFTAKQRLALAQRDGGCGWTGCDRPPSHCEAHHIDLHSEGGRTDVDRGILLCRFHHMNLHHHGWWITRHGTGPFILHSPDPDIEPVILHQRLERRYAFGDLQPPPTRFRTATPEAAA